MTAKRLAVLLCVFALCATLCSCGNAVKTAGGSSLTLWGESSGVKYLQNDGGEAAASRAASHTSLEVSMVRNETEAVQLMMYAKKDIAEYNVTVSDLVCGDSLSPGVTLTVGTNSTDGNYDLLWDDKKVVNKKKTDTFYLYDDYGRIVDSRDNGM